MTALPSVFVSHGAPTLAFDDVPARHFLQGLGAALGKPRAILCASAHWETAEPMVSTAPQPETIHDFVGFPAPLYRLRYPAPGDPDLAARAAALIESAGMRCAADPRRGLDHGAWVPLLLMYPTAEIPVVQLSVQVARSPAHHLALGRALAPLRREGVLVLGSGGATHNLGEFRGQAEDAPPPEHVRRFDAWLAAAAEAGDEAALIDYRRAAPEALRIHPRAEHFLPFFVAFGAGGPGVKGRRLHASFTYGVLSMAAFAFG
ncbi:MAG TPA: class III extradiol ring-cleavage dioxygenase [Alphaproteobacteria bacterium]|nr:class III extradiol ring-cleavage dioxygenase [Alphaproteobacteria bacterium]